MNSHNASSQIDSRQTKTIETPLNANDRLFGQRYTNHSNAAASSFRNTIGGESTFNNSFRKIARVGGYEMKEAKNSQHVDSPTNHMPSTLQKGSGSNGPNSTASDA